MKLTIARRIIASAMAVVLAVGLTPLSAFAEGDDSGTQETPKLNAQDAPGYVKWKTIDGLGIGSIGNPQPGAGGWDRVYFGSSTPEDLWLLNDFGDIDLITPSEPVLFNVLNNHETYFSSDGEPTMLLDCANVQYRYNPYHYYANPNWSGSYIRTNLRDHYTGYYSSYYGFKPGKFTEQEFLAIKPSTKLEPSPTDGKMWPESPAEYYYEFAPLNEDRVFILDAHEAMNESYGFPSNHAAKSGTRVKSGGHRISDDTNGIVKDWWLRSNGGDVWDWNAIVKSNGSIGGANITEKHGVSPALNLKLSSILFTSYLKDKTYKLTLRDSNMKVKIDGDVVRHGATVTVPYVLESDDNTNYGAYKVNRYSIIATSATWTSDGWSEDVSPSGYFMIGQYSSDPHVVSIPESFENPDTNLYLIAEHVSEGNATDYASDPVLLPSIKKGISANSYDMEYEYDGKAHGIWLTVTDPAEYTIKYGLEEGKYDYDTGRLVTNVTNEPVTIYYKVSADGYEDLEGSQTVTITPRTVKVGGITAKDKVYDGTTDAQFDYSQTVLAGKADGDDLQVSATGTFSSKNAGVDKTVTISGLTLEGAAAGNYKLATSGNQSRTYATITKRPVTVRGITAKSKPYDGNNLATLLYDDVSIDGMAKDDDLSVIGTGKITTGNLPGQSANVAISDLVLTGKDAGNYEFAPDGRQTETTVKITTVEIPGYTVEGVDVVYDGNFHEVKVQPVDPSNASVYYIFDQITSTTPPTIKYVGTQTIWFEIDSRSPFISWRDTVVARVTPRPVTVSGIKAVDKVYDGTTIAELDDKRVFRKQGE